MPHVRHLHDLENHIHKIAGNFAETSLGVEITKGKTVPVFYEHDLKLNRENMRRGGGVVCEKDNGDLYT